ncbi:MAG: SAM-dependent methyltransferase [Robiginitomaculum sp.]|nr:MAG: SAM-dependent methyltransferase [Robiginitomaculum sp.]
MAGTKQTPTKPGPFDRPLVKHRRGRSQKLSGDRFLYARIADDVASRVLDVSRKFKRTLLLGDKHLTHLVAQNLGTKIGAIIYADFTAYSNGLDVVCDEEALPFKAESFDLIINLMSLHGVNQVPAALAKIKTLLEPDGLFLGALFGGQTLSELRRAMYVAEEQIYGRVSPRISSMIRLDQATSLLAGSGFALPVADRDLITVNYTDLNTLYTDLRLMGETNGLLARDKAALSARFFQLVEKIYGREHGGATGKFDVSFEVLWLTGWRPHPAQPKPLKPGSAQTTLAGALGVQEGKF